MRLERGFHPRRKINSVNVRLHGRLLHPGDPIRIDSGPHAGRSGSYRGVAADGRLFVHCGLGSFQTMLRVERSQVRRKEIKATCHGAPKRA